MCELFGVSSPERIEVNDLLKEFFSHGREHPNGWGMAFFYGDGVSLEKEPVPSYQSTYLRERLGYRMETSRMIAHIRQATKGNMEYQNTHPFIRRDISGRAWTLAHNGTIFESALLSDYVRRQEGSTDSERILLYLEDRINRETRDCGHPLTTDDRFRVVDSVIRDIAPENKVNLLIYDGELLYVHTNLRKTLYQSKRGAALLFSTRPLHIGSWESVPMNTLYAYQNGVLRYTGQTHEYEFIMTEEKLQYLFLDYSTL